MKKVTTSPQLVTIAHYKNLLESEGIPAVIKNEHLGSIVPDLPFQEAWPELWVKNDLDLDRAKQLIDGVTVLDESGGARWRCPQCDEVNEAQFGACWSCARVR